MFELIKKFEGCRLKSYKCPAGIWTIGWGNTFYPDGSKVKEGDTINQKEADGLLLWYCTTKIKLPPEIYDYNKKEALYSLIFNVGQTSFDKSKCKKAIIDKDWATAYKEWDWGLNSGLKGLIARRNAEKELFFKGLI